MRRRLVFAFGTVMIVAALRDAHAGEASAAGKKLVVVAPSEFQASLAEFLAHKAKQLPTECVALEDVLKGQTGVDDPEKLKRFLFQRWRDDRVGYVLLVGDVDVMPVRYMVLDRVTPAAFDYAFYPSDLYYADLTKADGRFEDWNASRDGFHGQYLGEVRGEKNKDGPINEDQVDYLPEIGVGRWPVSTAEQVTIAARKTVRYEQGLLSDDKPGRSRAALLAVQGWVDSRRLLDGVARELSPRWQVTKLYYADGYPEPTVPPTEAALYDL
ncbi:MAG: C25 family cysteine peptidase, partial [Pirellulaceae bacterium]|nr:C25 family cysteine peptidase [Pirellulaceae bacterium]